MFSRLAMIANIPELRQKILLTFVLLGVFRMGSYIPLPFIDQSLLKAQIDKMQDASQGGGVGQAMNMISLFSASSIGMSTIFGLGIMPYISASIVFTLLGQVYPPLEKLQKEGDAGRRKINEYTRYATVVLCLFQSFFWMSTLMSNSGFMSSGGGGSLVLEGYNGLYYQVLGTIIMTSGTMLLMWIGEQIDEYGIGNGISLIIMAGILARMPQAFQQLLKPAFEHGVRLGSESGIEKLLLLAMLFVAVVVGVVAITQATRRIPIQSAKHVRGQRMMGGQRQFLPLKLNQSGVMPIIFASSLLIFPMMIFNLLSGLGGSFPLFLYLKDIFNNHHGYVYTLSYVALIFFFSYFWTAISFNPKDISSNLKDHGSFIPGYRPGVRTAAYLEQVMVRITYVGSAFLALIAIIPTFVSDSLGIDATIASFYGGTGLLICVSVAMDLVQKIDSHLVMRNYPGLLESE